MHKLAFADAVIYASARKHQVELVTADNHFEGLPGVTYFVETPLQDCFLIPGAPCPLSHSEQDPFDPLNDRRLIEHGFPCHQVGAETQRERGASSALPPLYFLHVWWARRPLTPSRAAIVASLAPGRHGSRAVRPSARHRADAGAGERRTLDPDR